MVTSGNDGIIGMVRHKNNSMICTRKQEPNDWNIWAIHTQ